MATCVIVLSLLALLASTVTGNVTRISDHHQLLNPVNGFSWDLLESVANSIDSRIDMMSGISLSDLPSLSLWDSYAGSSRSDRLTGVKIMNERLTDKQYVKSRIQMAGSILLGPEKSWSTLYSITPREHYSDDAKLQCIESTMTLFAKHCGFRNQYRHMHRRPFMNLCNHVADRTKIEEAFIVACGSKKVNGHVVNLSNPSLEVTPTPLDGSAEYCERIAVNGVSRLNFGSFAKVYHVLLKATTESSFEWYERTQICFHGNPSLGLCHCEKNDWRSFEHGVWSFVMSPYRQGILDIKYNSTVGDSLSISIEEVLQPWRYVFLVVGFAVFFVAPTIEKYILSMVFADVKAHSINWMIRVIALSCILQSSKDTPFALAVVACCCKIYSITRIIKDPSKFKKIKFWHWSGEETLEVSGPWSGQDMPKLKGFGYPRHQVGQQMNSIDSSSPIFQDEELYLNGSTFKSVDDLLKSVRAFYYAKGYGLSICAWKKDKYVILHCDRSGSYPDVRSIGGKQKRSTTSCLIECPFHIVGKKGGDGAWVFKIQNLAHNHEPSTDMSGHPSFCRLPEDDVQTVKSMTVSGIPQRVAFQVPSVATKQERTCYINDY